jgi:hypothetical protein
MCAIRPTQPRREAPVAGEGSCSPLHSSARAVRACQTSVDEIWADLQATEPLRFRRNLRRGHDTSFDRRSLSLLGFPLTSNNLPHLAH